MTQVARAIPLCLLALACTLGPVPVQAAPAATPAATAAPTAGPDGRTPIAESDAVDKRAKAEFLAWQSGRIDKSQYSKQLLAAATDEVVGNMVPQLKALGEFKAIQFTDGWFYLGVNNYQFVITCANGQMLMLYGLFPQGKVAGIKFRKV